MESIESNLGAFNNKDPWKKINLAKFKFKFCIIDNFKIIRNVGTWDQKKKFAQGALEVDILGMVTRHVDYISLYSKRK